jgi:S-adenosylmethionine hydrolase
MITLSSDFGSPYPGAMKGAILQMTDTRLVDIAHDLPRQDPLAGAFWLREILPSFPPAVHLAVVDIGVSTDRDAVVVRAGGHALVGPDNGVLVPVAEALAGEDSFDVFRVREGDSDTEDPAAWLQTPETVTFQGRDLFAPAAARVEQVGADGIVDDEGFEPIEEYEAVELPTPTVQEDGATGTVLAVDASGNVITNIPGEHVEERFGSHVEAGAVAAPVRRSYAEVDPGQRLVTIGSHGNVELAVNQGRGDRSFGVGVGDRIRLSW